MTNKSLSSYNVSIGSVYSGGFSPERSSRIDVLAPDFRKYYLLCALFRSSCSLTVYPSKRLAAIAAIFFHYFIFRQLIRILLPNKYTALSLNSQKTAIVWHSFIQAAKSLYRGPISTQRYSYRALIMCCLCKAQYYQTIEAALNARLGKKTLFCRVQLMHKEICGKYCFFTEIKEELGDRYSLKGKWKH